MNTHRWPRWLAASTATLGCVAVLSIASASAGDDSIKHVDQHFSGARVVGADAIHLVGMNPLAETVKVDVVATTVTPQPFPTNANPAAKGTPAATPAPVPKPISAAFAPIDSAIS